MSTTALNSAVLVLNRFYQAVHVTTVRRAFTLFCKGIVKAVDSKYLTYSFNDWKDLPAGDDFIRTPSYSLQIPRIVQLIHYEKVPKFHARFSRRNIFLRDRNRCQYCGNHFELKELSLDHVVPISRGGKHAWDNVVCSCLACNKKKGNRTPAESNMKLVRQPKRPRWIPFSRFVKKDVYHPSWKTFIDFAYWNVPLYEDPS